MSRKEQTVVLKRRTPARLAKLMEEAITVAYIIGPSERPTQQMLAAKAGRLGVVVPEFEAWVKQASKLRGIGFSRDQTLKSLPVVTGGKTSWTAPGAKEAKMSAVKKTNRTAIVAVLAKKFGARIFISSFVGTGNKFVVDFCRPRSKKLVRAVVRTGKRASIVFTKEQPDQPNAKKPVKKSKKAKKPAKKSKATGRGKAVVVYFNTDNLSVLAAARKYAKKQDESLASVVTEALKTWLEL